MLSQRYFRSFMQVSILGGKEFSHLFKGADYKFWSAIDSRGPKLSLYPLYTHSSDLQSLGDK